MTMTNTYKHKLYQDDHYDTIFTHLDSIMAETQAVIDTTFKPTKKDKMEVLVKIKQYIAQKQYIAYGGTAQNEMIKCKNPKDCFYDPTGIDDVDCYSPNPVEDVVEMANHFHKQGYNVTVRGALHPGSFSLKIDDILYCDMTFMPDNIYKTIPTIQHDGMRLIHPWIPVIDSLTIFTDPMRYNRLFAKHFSRSNLILSHYPLPVQQKTATAFHRPKPIIDALWKFISGRKSIIAFGLVAYRCYLKYVEKQTKTPQHPLAVSVPHLDVFSLEFNKDKKDIYEWLKTNADKAMYRNYYPFFQFTGHKVSFYCNSALVLNMYSHNDKCIPYHSIRANNVSVQIVTFQLLLAMLLVFYFETFVHVNKTNGKDYLTVVSNLLHLRRRFFNHTGKTPLDNTMFEEFKLHCKGTTIASLMDAQRRRARRKGFVWRYTPPTGKVHPVNLPKINGRPVVFASPATPTMPPVVPPVVPPVAPPHAPTVAPPHAPTLLPPTTGPDTG